MFIGGALDFDQPIIGRPLSGPSHVRRHAQQVMQSTATEGYLPLQMPGESVDALLQGLSDYGPSMGQNLLEFGSENQPAMGSVTSQPHGTKRAREDDDDQTLIPPTQRRRLVSPQAGEGESPDLSFLQRLEE